MLDATHTTETMDQEILRLLHELGRERRMAAYRGGAILTTSRQIRRRYFVQGLLVGGMLMFGLPVVAQLIITLIT